MRNRITEWVQQVSNKLLDNSGPVSYYTPPSLADIVEHAREEWLNSRAYFETVSDPDLVDHAIFMMEAAEKRYIYLLKRAREAGVTIDFQ
jgi:hypothetical protein